MEREERDLTDRADRAEARVAQAQAEHERGEVDAEAVAEAFSSHLQAMTELLRFFRTREALLRERVAFLRNRAAFLRNRAASLRDDVPGSVLKKKKT